MKAFVKVVLTSVMVFWTLGSYAANAGDSAPSTDACVAFSKKVAADYHDQVINESVIAAIKDRIKGSQLKLSLRLEGPNEPSSADFRSNRMSLFVDKDGKLQAASCH